MWIMMRKMKKNNQQKMATEGGRQSRGRFHRPPSMTKEVPVN